MEDIDQTEQTEQTEQDHRHSSCLPRERSGAYAEDSRLKSNEIEDSNNNLPTHQNQRNSNDCGTVGSLVRGHMRPGRRRSSLVT